MMRCNVTKCAFHFGLLLLMVQFVSAQAVTVEHLDTVAFSLSEHSWSATQRSLTGELFVLSTKSGQIHRISPQGQAHSFDLSRPPERETAVGGRVVIMPHLALDSLNQVYLPGLWHQIPAGHRGKHFASGVFVHDSSGSHLRTVRLGPPVEARRVAVDDSGNVYVTGLDPEYFRGLSDNCSLVHKYSADGRRLAQFSTCPSNPQHTLRTSAQNSAVFARFREELDRSHLWIKDRRVYHLLSHSLLLRVFDEGGKPIREVSLIPPDEQTILSEPFPLTQPVTERMVSQVFSRPGDSLLVRWALVAGTHRRAYFALHSSDGKPLSRGTVWVGRVPVASDDSGHVYFVNSPQSSSGTTELVRARLSVR